MSSPSKNNVKAKLIDRKSKTASEAEPAIERKPETGPPIRAGEHPPRVAYEADVEKAMRKNWDTLARSERAFLQECFGLEIPAATAVQQLNATRAFFAACRNLKAAGHELDRTKIEALMAASQAGLPAGFIERGLELGE